MCCRYYNINANGSIIIIAMQIADDGGRFLACSSRHVCCGSNAYVAVYSAQTGRQLWRSTRARSLFVCHFSADSSLLVITQVMFGPADIRCADTGAVVHTVNDIGNFLSVISADRRRLACAATHTVRVATLATRERCVLDVPNYAVLALAWSGPTRLSVAIECHMLSWDLMTQNQSRVHVGAFKDCQLSADGQRALLVNDQTMTLVSVATGQRIFCVDRLDRARFWLAANGTDLVVWLKHSVRLFVTTLSDSPQGLLLGETGRLDVCSRRRAVMSRDRTVLCVQTSLGVKVVYNLTVLHIVLLLADRLPAQVSQSLLLLFTSE